MDEIEIFTIEESDAFNVLRFRIYDKEISYRDLVGIANQMADQLLYLGYKIEVNKQLV